MNLTEGDVDDDPGLAGGFVVVEHVSKGKHSDVCCMLVHARSAVVRRCNLRSRFSSLLYHCSMHLLHTGGGRRSVAVCCTWTVQVAGRKETCSRICSRGEAAEEKWPMVGTAVAAGSLVLVLPQLRIREVCLY